MADPNTKVHRTLHVRFTAPSADPKQLLAMMQAAKPFYEFFGCKDIRLQQNVDDPARYVQIIEYETDAGIEINRQQLASDARWQSAMLMWRSVVSGSVDVEVFRDTDDKTNGR